MSTFSTGTNFPAGTSPQSFTAENCNNDNIPDLNIPDLGIAPTTVSLKSMTQPSSKAIAFIDSAVPDCQTLIDGIIPETDSAASGDQQREAKLIELLIDMRKRARADKNYAESDRIRDKLAKAGVVLEDRADGTVWRVN